MSIHKERTFEDELVEHLTANGWLLGDAGKYDRALALYPEDLLGWVQETQPQQWAKYAAHHGSAAPATLLARVAAEMDKHGSLAVLRHGLKDFPSRFQLCQFRPGHAFNPALQALHGQVRCRVVRQVHYSKHKPHDSIDLVLFLNGVPVATLELKTDFTQSIADAIKQYRTDRLPSEPKSKQEEPLLAFRRRALVHFAVSSEEVYMATRLEGAATTFLPFNLGNGGGKGNPLNPTGCRTAYLWEQVLQRDAWLDIIGRFLNLETRDGRERLVFPRFHQWQVVNRLEDAARAEGAGKRYLIQHSAGSGKSNSIAWLAHRLSTLHQPGYGKTGQAAVERKLFDSVIVVTDRTVLDKQLQETIYDIEHKQGVVCCIRDEGPDSKSKQLAEALTERKAIVIVTIQTFPALLELLQREQAGNAAAPALGTGRYALIVDEAHSSQSSNTSISLKKLLAEVGIEEDEEYSTEDLLLAQQKTHLLPPNMSVFAFTATPKAKTIELFGRMGPDGKPVPFHVYSMKQAIEEGFILDVLLHYTPVKLAYKLAYAGGEVDERTIDKGEGLKQLKRWMRLNPYNIEQKVALIVEHFRATVAPHLHGRAKAMVVTSSRKEAVRFALAMRRYIHGQGYALHVLVAFSGEVHDPESGPAAFSEHNLNPALKGRDIRTAFAGDEQRILIVANKFQTGFDQPLLVAMYVDKKLAGINAVQTLSRLNRTHPGKSDTFVVDFVNTAEEIYAAFKPYYETAQLAGVSDPNLITDLQRKLDDAHIYTEEELDALVAVVFGPKPTHAAAHAAVSPAAERFAVRWKAATAAGDGAAQDALVLFRKDVGSFQRLYAFLSQIYDYDDGDLEKRAIFFDLLLRLLDVERQTDAFDLSAIELTHYRLHDQSERAIHLVQEAGGDPGLPPLSAAGSAELHDPQLATLAEIVAQMNDLFAGELTDADLVTYARHITDKLLENEDLAQQAASSSKEQFALGGFNDAFLQAILDGLDSYQAMANQVLVPGRTHEGFRQLVRNWVYTEFSKRRAGAAQP